MQRKVSALDAMVRKLIASKMSQGNSMEDIAAFLKKNPDEVEQVLAGSSFFADAIL